MMTDQFDDCLRSINPFATDKWSIRVSPRIVRRIRRLERLGRLYRAHPIPPRKLRKCHMRTLQRVRRKGEAHIDRVERCEARREREAVRHGV